MEGILLKDAERARNFIKKLASIFWLMVLKEAMKRFFFYLPHLVWRGILVVMFLVLIFENKLYRGPIRSA